MVDLAQYKELLAEYDNIVIGKKKMFSTAVFVKAGGTGGKSALAVVQYAFVNYLHWTPEAIAENATDELIGRLHLTQVMPYIEFPPEYDETHDYYYLAALLFPKYGLSAYDRTVHIYEKVLDGELKKFPKGYFFGSDGMARAGICLQYMINTFLTFSSINELYHIFGTDAGFCAIKKYALSGACRDDFYTPVDYLHFSLPDSQKDEFLFHFYKFKYLREMFNENGRKQHRFASYLLAEPDGRIGRAKPEGATKDEKKKPSKGGIWKED